MVIRVKERLTIDRSRRAARRLAIALAVAAAVTTAGAAALSKQDADSMQRKLVTILANGHTRAGEPRTTTVTEAEVNSYFKYHAAGSLPAGLVDPQISILGNGRLSGRAIVDLDQVRQKSKSWGAALLTGRLPVAATGILRTRNGVGRLEIETVEVAGVTVPKTLLQELVSYYSRTPADPQGVSLDDPFPLPAAIREIKIDKGRALIVQ